MNAEKKDYVYLRAWCEMMGSFPFYIESQLRVARGDNAPDTAIYCEQGEWQVFENIKNTQVRNIIERLVAGYNSIE